jgi:hypothetical protein
MVFLVFHYGFFLIVKSNQEHFYFWLNKKKEKKVGARVVHPGHVEDTHSF